ncbi:MAG: RHS domain-containing protein [Chloroflexi bacterium]|nr:RHS domain-containing protein [Chloroflexota bacterium]MBP8059514.1 RHS domain-containing protein [Chloroflexota bacterium]
MDGELFYHLNDPSGTSLTMTDAEGDTAWQVVYDGYGAVLTGTMPVTLAQTLLDMPDGTTGLVHLGNGRYYDPALGRPLQPNPAGAPPTVPQALNRYAAAPLSQPGVYQATMNNGVATAFGHQIPGTALGVAIELSPASRVIGKEVWGEIEEKFLSTTGVAGWINWAITSRVGQFLPRLPLLGKWVAAKYAGRYQTVTSIIRLDQGGTLADELLAGGGVVSSRYYTARLLRQWEVPVIERGTYGTFYPRNSLLKSSIAAGVISFGFQLYDDWDNPYLTGEQKGYRSLISGGIGFGATLAGGWVGAKIGAALGTGVAPGVGTAIGAITGFTLGTLGELYVVPQIFEWTGNTPARHLAPLP